jgi:hypothetical protein
LTSLALPVFAGRIVVALTAVERQLQARWQASELVLAVVAEEECSASWQAEPAVDSPASQIQGAVVLQVG